MTKRMDRSSGTARIARKLSNHPASHMHFKTCGTSIVASASTANWHIPVHL